eukprot:955938-Rhodomonas_salina.1
MSVCLSVCLSVCFCCSLCQFTGRASQLSGSTLSTYRPCTSTFGIDSVNLPTVHLNFRHRLCQLTNRASQLSASTLSTYRPCISTFGIRSLPPLVPTDVSPTTPVVN